jgi:Putative transposase
MTLAAEEFIRRFLLHVLPDGFHRIRHYGYLANGHRGAKLALCRQLLAASATHPSVVTVDSREPNKPVTVQPNQPCPHCGDRMRLIALLPRALLPLRPQPWNTS